MAGGFTNQTIVVTGGSSGLGLAVARAFLREGAHVFLLARDGQRLDAARDLLRQDFPSVGTIAADVTCQQQVRTAFDEVRRTRGGLNPSYRYEDRTISSDSKPTASG